MLRLVLVKKSQDTYLGWAGGGRGRVVYVSGDSPPRLVLHR